MALIAGDRIGIQACNDEGAAAWTRGDFPEAVRLWESAIRALTPTDDDLAPDLYENAGLAYLALRRHVPAIRCFLRGLEGDVASREQSARLVVAALALQGHRNDAFAALADYEAAHGAYRDPRIRGLSGHPPLDSAAV